MNLTDVLTPVPGPDAAPPKKTGAELLKESRITMKTEVPPVVPSVIIDETVVCTEGGLLVVSGQKKAGKSNAIVYILATALMEEVDTDKTLRIRTVKQKKDIVYIDTEQSPAKTKEFLNRVYRIAGISEERDAIRFHNIRKYELDDRFEILKAVLEEAENIGLLVIDGIADIVGDINDLNKATALGDMIFKYLRDDMTLVTAIHEGKDGQGAMGHIGQYLEKKCSGTIAMFKDRRRKVHTMKCKMVREGGDFEDIEFVWSDTEKGFVLLNEELKNMMNENKDETEKQELKGLFSNIFYEKTEMPHSTLRERIIGHDPKIKVDSSKAAKQRAALRRIDKALESGILTVIREDKRDKIYKLNRD